MHSLSNEWACILLAQPVSDADRRQQKIAKFKRERECKQRIQVGYAMLPCAVLCVVLVAQPTSSPPCILSCLC
jgi:hypothetical protein